MAEQVVPTATTGQKEKEEIEKLRLENAQMRRPWRSPAFLIAAGGLALSVIGNVQQFASAAASHAEAAATLSFEREKWADERKKLDLQVAELQTKLEISAEDREAIQNELAEINRNIQILDNAIHERSLKLLVEQNRLKLYQMQKREAKAEAHVNVVSNEEWLLQQLKAEREQLVARRTEREKQLPR